MERHIMSFAFALLATSFYFTWEISAVDLRNDLSVAALSEADTQFAFDIYRKCSQALSGKNLFLSPFSISTALGLTELGARGITEQQMAQTLKWSSSKIPVEGYGKYLAVLQDESASTKSGYLLASAQRIYLDKKLTLQANFTAAARQYFRADAQSANFAGDAENERKRINAWVALQTHNKIPDLLGPGMVNPLTSLILLQALYFKGSWLHKFDSAKTEDGVFQAARSPVSVHMMSQTRNFKYTHNAALGFSAVELPYGSVNGSENADVSMLVVLPDTQNGLEELEKKLTPEVLANLRKSLFSRKVNVKLPRFSMESSLDLKSVLLELGMGVAFSDFADFSGLVVGNAGLHISDVVHKAVIQVNEEGAEAAAATGVGLTPLAVMRPVDFIADHPFLIFINDNRANVILFMGRYVAPQ